MKQAVYFLLIFILCSCSQNKKQDNPRSSGYSNNPVSNGSYSNGNSKYNIQSDRNYQVNPKYEYRIGSSGNYEYNYDISGSDENGNSVNGNIDIQGKYGSGYIEDEDGNEKYIDVEWIDHGVLEGTDEDGNTYEFEVDE